MPIVYRFFVHFRSSEYIFIRQIILNHNAVVPRRTKLWSVFVRDAHADIINSKWLYWINRSCYLDISNSSCYSDIKHSNVPGLSCSPCFLRFQWRDKRNWTTCARCLRGSRGVMTVTWGTSGAWVDWKPWTSIGLETWTWAWDRDDLEQGHVVERYVWANSLSVWWYGLIFSPLLRRATPVFRDNCAWP